MYNSNNVIKFICLYFDFQLLHSLHMKFIASNLSNSSSLSESKSELLLKKAVIEDCSCCNISKKFTVCFNLNNDTIWLNSETIQYITVIQNIHYLHSVRQQTCLWLWYWRQQMYKVSCSHDSSFECWDFLSVFHIDIFKSFALNFFLHNVIDSLTFLKIHVDHWCSYLCFSRYFN